MKYQCRYDCHCKLRWQITNDEHESASIHVFTGANYDSGGQSPGCDKCKDLPEDFTFEDWRAESPPLSCVSSRLESSNHQPEETGLANAIGCSTPSCREDKWQQGLRLGIQNDYEQLP